MKRLSGILIILFIGLMMFSACKSKQENSQDLLAINAHEVKVLESIHTTEYTYFRVSEENTEYWLAAPKREAKNGATLYYTTAWEMADFKSTELDRVFDKVLFVQDLTDVRPQGNMGAAGDNSQVHMGTPRTENPVITQPAAEIAGVVEGETSLNDVLSKSADFANKLVTVSGKVTKVNPEIMGKNWIHITTADPADKNDYDLTITTREVFTVDQVITVQGQISIDKDFGAGYKYGVIMENAKSVSK